VIGSFGRWRRPGRTAAGSPAVTGAGARTQPSSTTEHSIDIAGLNCHYRQTGDPGASPVVLLHGGGSSAATWDTLAAALATAGHRVIAPDLRGHGRSSRPGSYSLNSFRDDAVGLLDALALDHVALVGHSLGAHVAILVAQQHPDRVTRLILEDPPAPARDRAAATDLSPARVLLLALGSLSRRRRYDPRALASVISQLRVTDPGWWDGLSVITAPALVISGGPASHVSEQLLTGLVRTLRHAMLETIPVGHRIDSTSPERFQAIAVPFLTPETGVCPPADPARG